MPAAGVVLCSTAFSKRQLHSAVCVPEATPAAHDCARPNNTLSHTADVANGCPCSHSHLVVQDDMHELRRVGVVGVLDLRTTMVPVATGEHVAEVHSGAVKAARNERGTSLIWALTVCLYHCCANVLLV